MRNYCALEIKIDLFIEVINIKRSVLYKRNQFNTDNTETRPLITRRNLSELPSIAGVFITLTLGLWVQFDHIVNA